MKAVLEPQRDSADGRIQDVADERTFHEPDTYVIIFAAVLVLLASYSLSVGDQANSRLATVYSLTHDHAWRIDHPLDRAPNPYERGTVDKVMIDGRLISSKPPVLPLLMTAEYLVLNRIFGLDLDVREDAKTLVRLMSVSLIGLAYIVVLVMLSRTMKLFDVEPIARITLLLCAAFASQLWGYATTINNHVPAAALLSIALYIALGILNGRLGAAWWRFFLFGFAGALVPALDMPAGLFILLAGVCLLSRYPRQTSTGCLAGAAVPLAVHFGATYSATGGLLPVQLNPSLYLYEGSYWRNPGGMDALNESSLTYLFHMTFGRQGFFALYPILTMGLLALFFVFSPTGAPFRRAVCVGALGVLGLLTYYASSTNNYGGSAYGFRWLIVATPVLLLMAAPVLGACNKRWQWTIICVLLAVSTYSAWECTQFPWKANREWTTRIYGPNY